MSPSLFVPKLIRRQWMCRAHREDDDCETNDVDRTHTELIRVGGSALSCAIHKKQLEEYGFKLVRKYPTSLDAEMSHCNHRRVKLAYYDEVAKLISDATGASYVHCFQHDTKNGSRKIRKPRSVRRGCTPFPCGDATAATATMKHECALEDMKKKGIDNSSILQGRYMIIKALRNISDSNVTEYCLSSPDRHQSYCVSIAQDDVLLFKEYDSDSPSDATMTCFGTFGQSTLSHPPPRQSIEVYCVAFLPKQ